MALSEERRNRCLETLKNTAVSHGALEFPKECYEFTKLCDIETVVMPQVDGFEYTVYILRAHNRTEKCPVSINIHGGGFVRPHMENDMMFSSWLADAIRGTVVSVDYTTSDKAPFPVAFNQCYAVGKYVEANCEEWGCDSQRISMGGYSAGGTLTAGVALKAAQTGDFKLCLQILGYAPIEYALHPLYKKNGYVRMMPWEREMTLTELYFGGNMSLCRDPYAAPACADDEMLSRLPRTLVLTASSCNFCFEDEDYAARLVARGIEVTVKRFPNTKHGFIPHFMPGWLEASRLIARIILSARL